MQNSHLSHAAGDSSEEFNIVAVWLRKDPHRWIAGVLAGLFAGAAMLAFAGILAQMFGSEFWMPVKVAAIPWLGLTATALGKTSAIAVGLATHAAICAVLGFTYAHFTGTNELPTLLGAGFTWGCFSWIFIFNLFSQSFREIEALHLSKGAGFFIMMVFGISLTSVAFFDRLVRGGRPIPQ